MKQAWIGIVCGVIAAGAACGKRSDGSPTGPTPPANPQLTAPAVEAPASDQQLDTLRPTLTVRNGTSDQAGARTYEFQISDSPDFSTAVTAYLANYRVTVTKSGVPEGANGTTSLVLDTDLQPTTRFYWRARVAQGSVVSAWSTTGKFRSRLVGFFRDGEIFDPMIHGETVGEKIGPIEYVPGRGLKLVATTSYIRYSLPRPINNGEFSMEVEGLRANAPGDKTKVFGMQDGDDDFVENRYRVDAQYRGTAGFPPNAIQWRAMFGSDEDRIEPDTAKRFESVFLLDPARAYYWKATWSNGFRLTVLDGGINGTVLYDYGITANVSYDPRIRHNVYVGTPTGRSGTESASIPGTIYRNVWIGNKPRPASLGSALWVSQ